jgi:hypothetical protein
MLRASKELDKNALVGQWRAMWLELKTALGATIKYPAHREEFDAALQGMMGAVWLPTPRTKGEWTALLFHATNAMRILVMVLHGKKAEAVFTKQMRMLMDDNLYDPQGALRAAEATLLHEQETSSTHAGAATATATDTSETPRLQAQLRSIAEQQQQLLTRQMALEQRQGAPAASSDPFRGRGSRGGGRGGGRGHRRQ